MKNVIPILTLNKNGEKVDGESKCNPILIGHKLIVQMKENLGLSGGKSNQTCYAKQWNNDYQLDLIGREYCRDRQIGCDQKEFAILMTWQQAKQQFIMAHTKWVETILEQLKVLKGGLRDHIYLEQSIDMCKKMGITIS